MEIERRGRESREKGYEVKHHQLTHEKIGTVKESAHIRMLWIDFIGQSMGHGAAANYLYLSQTPREISGGQQICGYHQGTDTV